MVSWIFCGEFYWHYNCLLENGGELKLNTIELLEAKKDNFKKIKSIADNQKELVASDRMHEYFLLSDQRDRIKRGIESDHKKYRSVFDKADRREREMAISINKEISEVIESIMDIDKKIEQLVRVKKDGFLNEIKGLKKSRTAVKSYGNKNPRLESRFIKTIG